MNPWFFKEYSRPIRLGELIKIRSERKLVMRFPSGLIQHEKHVHIDALACIVSPMIYKENQTRMAESAAHQTRSIRRILNPKLID